MRRNVQCYTIKWYPSNHATYDPNIDSSIVILSKIFFQDYDKHPFLKKIKIVFGDDENLFYLGKLLYYFNQHYQKLFVERKLYLKHFQIIELNVNIVKSVFTNNVIKSFGYNNASQTCGDMSTMFDQTSNKEYPIDKKVIEIKNVKQGLDSFGIIYHNIVSWLRARQLQQGEKYYKEAVKDCTVLFVLPV